MVVLIGCGMCAAISHPGGDPEIEERARTLTQHGKKILAAIAPPFGERAR